MAKPSKAVRTQVEEYILAEIARVGVENVDANAIFHAFKSKDVGKSTIYGWIRQIKGNPAPLTSKSEPIPPPIKPGAPPPPATQKHQRASMERRPGAVVDARAIRMQTGLSQFGFAARFGFSMGAVRQWERGVRQPEIAARVLLLIIAKRPEVVREALAELQAIEDTRVAAESAAISEPTPAPDLSSSPSSAR